MYLIVFTIYNLVMFIYYLYVNMPQLIVVELTEDRQHVFVVLKHCIVQQTLCKNLIENLIVYLIKKGLKMMVMNLP